MTGCSRDVSPGRDRRDVSPGRERRESGSYIGQAPRVPFSLEVVIKENGVEKQRLVLAC